MISVWYDCKGIIHCKVLPRHDPIPARPCSSTHYKSDPPEATLLWMGSADFTSVQGKARGANWSPQIRTPLLLSPGCRRINEIS
ncbi:hypothetical protein Y032_0168g201 [Ancylostoma ceylanicum]|uniref:Uncharacterized protein n=1 Tax=Ancylostoma ceylanicum TaxID=53326 RepID=A0A016SVJ7_9BILA|nr:hypothetical protein Y032_0168g201 [Ancylostoma ceylanicum]